VKERISANPKLNNCFKGWNAAAHDWIVLADSNVLMPPDYLTRLWNAWRHDDTGLVCSPPSGSQPDGFWAGVECAFLNTYEARWQYGADTLGLGFAQGWLNTEEGHALLGLPRQCRVVAPINCSERVSSHFTGWRKSNVANAHKSSESTSCLAPKPPPTRSV